MIRILDASREDVAALLRARLISQDRSAQEVVAQIIEDVRARGDEALLEGARRFDCPTLESILVSDSEWDGAESRLKEGAYGGMRPMDAIDAALERVLHFHREQRRRLDTAYPDGRWRLPNQDVGQRLLTLASSGVYVPGGLASYPSSVIMNAGPARAAGVERIAITTPVGRDGKIHAGVLYAARKLGIGEIIKVGGAYAIAALALGTESIRPVDKVVGPGNRFVNEAKRQLWGRVGLDGYAGSSEVCVLADESANPAFAAADLLTQVEHAEDNAGFLVCTSRGILDAILAEADHQMKGAPRERTMRTALANEGWAIVARDISEAVELVNLIAPEHLSVATAQPDDLLPKIHNAGCVLLGEWTPESGGDYAIGPSHTLPTAGAARFGSPVNVLDFVKVQSVSHLRRDELLELAPIIEAFGAMEGFPTHGAGATIRRGG